MRCTFEDVAAWRATRHGLHARAPRGSLLDVTSRLCGLHAQVMSSAELTAWARVDDLAREDVAAALWEERTLVKTWAMRGTLHLLPASELALWHGALATYDHFRRVSWQKAFGVPDELDTLLEAISRALDGEPLSGRSWRLLSPGRRGARISARRCARAGARC